MPMFPDSGVPASDAKYAIDVTTVEPCDELWYSTSRCQPRFDPAAANAMLAEIMNVIMKGEVLYDCKNLNNLERAIRYIVQRGLPLGATLAAGPLDYICTLDPPLTRYNDYMTLLIVPNVDNQSAVRIDAGQGMVPLLRNDRQPLQFGDLKAGIPTLIAYYAGYWYHIGLCASQVPIVLTGVVDFWIRTDGNDTSGDGSVNTPERAFRTIAGAWAKVGSRFAATPSLLVRLRFGIPGTYQGCTLGPFGGSLVLLGDPDNRDAYRISTFDFGGSFRCALLIGGVSAFSCVGCCILLDTPGTTHTTGIRFDNSSIQMNACSFEAIASNPISAFFFGSNGGISCWGQHIYFRGNGNTIGGLIATFSGGSFSGGGFGVLGNTLFHFNDFVFAQAGQQATILGIIDWWWADIVAANCTGPIYVANANSIISAHGLGAKFPGTVPGTLSSGGQFVA